MSGQTEIMWGEVVTKVSDLDDWRDYRLDELTEPVKNQYNPDGSSDFIYIGLEHIQQETLRLNAPGDSSDVTSNKFKFEAGDVLFGKLRPYFRKVARPKFGGICSTDIWVFRAKEDIDQGFLFYFLASWDFVNLANSGEGGTRMPRADWKFLQTTEWSIPPLPEQRAIAGVLSSLDDKIDLLHRQNATLEALAETLFRQWFVEQAKEEWEDGVVGDLVDFTYGKALKDQDRTGIGYPVYGSNGVVGYHSQYLVEGPGIVTGRKGTLGVIHYSFTNFFPIDTAFYVLSKTGSKGLYFEYFLLKSLKLEDCNTDSAVPGLNRNLAHSMQVSIPPVEKIHAFNEHVGPYFQKTKINQAQIQTLSTLRDTLLPKLMSGEVRVAY